MWKFGGNFNQTSIVHQTRVWKFGGNFNQISTMLPLGLASDCFPCTQISVRVKLWVLPFVLGAMGKSIPAGAPKMKAIKDKPTPKASPMKASPKAVTKSALKKPAAASGSLLRRMNAMQEEDPEPEQETSLARDKGKAVKFQKMKNQNSLPAFVVDLIEEQSKASSAPRNQKTLLINKLFKRLPDGSLELSLDQPVFEQAEKVAWLIDDKHNTDDTHNTTTAPQAPPPRPPTTTTTPQHHNTTTPQHHNHNQNNNNHNHHNTTTPQHHNTNRNNNNHNHHNTTTTQHHNTTAPQHHSTTTPQHHNTTTPQYHNTTTITTTTTTTTTSVSTQTCMHICLYIYIHMLYVYM